MEVFDPHEFGVDLVSIKRRNPGAVLVTEQGMLLMGVAQNALELKEAFEASENLLSSAFGSIDEDTEEYDIGSRRSDFFRLHGLLLDFFAQSQRKMGIIGGGPRFAEEVRKILQANAN